MKKNLTPALFIIFVALLAPVCSYGHVLNYDLAKLSSTDIAFTYLKLGYTHIIPLGLDHILFVLSLFFLNPKLKPVITQATAFTVAHSITLGLAMYKIITPPSSIIEPIIALSIVFVALENMITSQLKPWRIVIVFFFGLVHGMGFASALTDLGLPRSSFATGLVMFNLGVELGQVTIILLAYFLVGKWFGKMTWYRRRIVFPVSIIIALVAAFWTVQRVFFT